MNRHTALGILLSANLIAGVPVPGTPASERPRVESTRPQAATQPRAITVAAFKFAPAELTVSVGDTVVWINDDMFLHTTTADSGAWASAELNRGQRFLFVPRRAGRFPYHCAAHPVMRAVIHVRE